MWRPEESPRYALPDVDRFLDVLNRSADFFAPLERIYVARAPGRLDLMGGIADYSGALVLELPLNVATFAAVQAVPEQTLVMQTTAAADIGVDARVAVPLDTLLPRDEPLDYSAAHELLTANARESWAAYVAGVLVVLQRECGVRGRTGLRVLVHSEVPPSAGVSSSAALEVAAMWAICAAWGVELEGREVEFAQLCQKVENVVVGAPCGVMDQMTSACGQRGRLYALLCQPAEPQGLVPLPPEVEVWGICSGVRHGVSGADYTGVRVGAFMGYRIIAHRSALPATSLGDGRVAVDDSRWHGYLANVTPAQWELEYRELVPHRINGAAFLERYGGSTDQVTRVDPARTYAVRAPTAHPIYEHQRVGSFLGLLKKGSLGEDQLSCLGKLMYKSHASYGACGLGSEATDRLVELVRDSGPAAGLYGAKITGGGCGGTVAVLARRGARSAVEQVKETYERQTGRHATVVGGSSPGAVQFGGFQLVPSE
jgi:L-arabinokinase